MSITGDNKKIVEGGSEKDAFVVTFTNGALEQLNELKAFTKKTDLLEVIKFSIGVLERIKQNSGGKNNDKESS